MSTRIWVIIGFFCGFSEPFAAITKGIPVSMSMLCTRESAVISICDKPQQEVSMNRERYETRNGRTRDVSSMNSEQVWVRSRAVVSRTIAGETLIVPVRGKVGDLASIYSFNETGSLIWRLLEMPRTLIEIADAIAREFDVGREPAESDAIGFLRELLSVGLVEVSKTLGEAKGPVGREGLVAADAR